MAEILMTKTISGQLAPMDDFAVQKIAALNVTLERLIEVKKC